MAAPAIKTQGTTITITDSGDSPVTFHGHQSMTGIGSGRATKIPVTTLESTAMEYRMGLQDWGDFTLNFIWNPDDAGQAAMLDAKATQATREMIITTPATDPTVILNVYTFDCLVLGMQMDINADGVMQGTATIAISGDVVVS